MAWAVKSRPLYVMVRGREEERQGRGSGGPDEP